MRFLIDMNMSPRWCAILEAEGWDSDHWSNVGNVSASDHDVMLFAISDQRIVLTHDLDFGAMLAATNATAPSVAQVRTQDVRPQTLAPLLIPLLRQHESALAAGALLIVDEMRSRIRLLPLRQTPRL